MQPKSQAEFTRRYGPWAIVAGASEGLGAAYAQALAARKLNLLLVARRAELLQDEASRVKRQYAINTETLPVDLSRPGSFEEVVEVAKGLEVGLLIYNAGFSVEGPFLGHSLDDHLEEIYTNVHMPIQLVYHFGQRMLHAHHGGIILMGSLSAFQGSAYIANYSATKAYNMILAEGLWEEWRRQGVDVLACMAGAVRTPNYIASQPRSAGRFADATLEPERVVAETLSTLGKKALVIPGRMNRISSFIMRRLLSREAAIRLMGSVLRKMYLNSSND